MAARKWFSGHFTYFQPVFGVNKRHFLQNGCRHSILIKIVQLVGQVSYIIDPKHTLLLSDIAMDATTPFFRVVHINSASPLLRCYHCIIVSLYHSINRMSWAKVNSCHWQIPFEKPYNRWILKSIFYTECFYVYWKHNTKTNENNFKKSYIVI